MSRRFRIRHHILPLRLQLRRINPMDQVGKGKRCHTNNEFCWTNRGDFERKNTLSAEVLRPRRFRCPPAIERPGRMHLLDQRPCICVYIHIRTSHFKRFMFPTMRPHFPLQYHVANIMTPDSTFMTLWSNMAMSPLSNVIQCFCFFHSGPPQHYDARHIV